MLIPGIARRSCALLCIGFKPAYVLNLNRKIMKTIFSFLHHNRRKYFVVIAFNLFIISATLTLPVTVHSAGIAAHPGEDWVLDKTVSNVEFYHAIRVCNGKNTVFLKFVNRNTRAVKVTWKEVVLTPDRQRKEGYAGKKEMLIQPGITTTQDCADVDNKKTIVRGSELDPLSVVEIAKFMYQDITVTDVQ
jgi:hypothetical protein